MISAPNTKLPALTPLRFLAAALVVVVHSQSLLGWNSNRLRVGSQHAVSFFFVLSGFILYHVYPELKDWSERRRFLLARFARIYPAYLASLALVLVLLPAARLRCWNTPGSFIASLLLLQSWACSQAINFGFNGAAWSISTEAFFYACFPLLLLNWQRTWRLKLGLVFAALAACCLLASFLWPLAAQGENAISVGKVIYTNPVVRLFEFAAGMMLRLSWGRSADRWRLTRSEGTVLEILALGAVVGVVYQISFLTGLVTRTFHLPNVAGLWLWQGGIALPTTCLLIAVMANGRGWVSRFFAHRIPIFLGEISYALYLIHAPLLQWCETHLDAFAAWPRWLLVVAYWTVSLIGAYLLWRLVERPCRAFLIRPRREVKSVGAPPANRIAA